MKTYTFTVPGLPVCKERPRVGKYGNLYTPSKTKAYEEQVAICAREMCPDMEPTLTICHLDARWKILPDNDGELEVGMYA